jgi:hypothetical protein
MPPRIFVVDGRPAAATAIAELLGDRAGEVVGAGRDVATAQLRSTAIRSRRRRSCASSVRRVAVRA